MAAGGGSTSPIDQTVTAAIARCNTTPPPRLHIYVWKTDKTWPTVALLVKLD
ncbi:MAG: hypothetical protein U0350_28630 [Caldilineaceae bacterium]